MPDVKRLGPLIDRLRVLSEENRVPWTETADERTFQAPVGSYVVTIAQDYVGENWGEPVYVYAIRIHDPLGKLLDAATEKEFPVEHVFSGRKRAPEAFGELYDLARRKALNVDQALDDLLKSL